MCGAIAGVLAPRMAAEGDRLALLVAAVGVAAIARFKLDQREMARLDLQAQQRWQIDAFEDRYEPFRRGGESFAQVMQAHLLRFRRLPRRLARALAPGEAHSSSTAKR